MKNSIYAALLVVAVSGATMTGLATAGDNPRSDAPRDTMRADTDGDGKVSRAEADAASDKRTGEWFEKLDLDKDGFVTSDEVKQARETRRGDMKARFDEHFKEADSNNDGQLSLDEVQAKMPRLADRFTALDTDKNGMLSKQELAAGHGGGPGHRRPPQPQG